MTIDIKQIASLLGEQTKVIPTFHKNVHAIEEGKVLDISQAWSINESKMYPNAVILPQSAPEGLCYVLIDQDDHKSKGELDDLSSLGLPDTYTVKTKRGGLHRLYYMKMEEAQTLLKDKFEISEFPNTEFFVYNRDVARRIVAPGSKTKEGEYTLIKAMKPAMLPRPLIETFIVQSRAFSAQQQELLQQHAHMYQGEEDKVENIRAFNDWLNKTIEPFELGMKAPMEDGDGRDNFLYACLRQGSTYNLSAHRLYEMVSKKIAYNTTVMFDPPCTDDQLETKAKNAYETTQMELRSNERMVQKYEPFPYDENGARIVERDALKEKVLYLASKPVSMIMSNESLLKLLCETIVYSQSEGIYYVAQCLSEEFFLDHYRAELDAARSQNLPINYPTLLEIKKHTQLHWQRLQPRMLNENYKFQAGTTRRGITSHAYFGNYSFICNINNIRDPNIVINKYNLFNPLEKSVIEPAEDATKDELKQVETLVMRHLSAIVDPNNQKEEANHILDYYALLLQNQSIKLDTILVFQGPQGSGKTGLVTLMQLLFPANKTTILNNTDDIFDKFVEKNRITHCDDIDLNLDHKTIDFLKASSTSSTRVQELKYENRRNISETVHYTFATNTQINNIEVLQGRRFTIFMNWEAMEDQVRSNYSDLIEKFMANEWRLYRVFAQFMLQRKVKEYKRSFKTKRQLTEILEQRFNHPIIKGFAQMIANYGYISPTQHVVVPRDLVSRADLYVLLTDYYDDMSQDPNDLAYPHNGRISSAFGKELRNARVKFNESFKDMNKRRKSRINEFIPNKWTCKVPSIKKWIELFAYMIFNDTDPRKVEFLVDAFNFHDQWEWDNKTKPKVENLGRIDAFENVDLYSLYEDDRF